MFFNNKNERNTLLFIRDLISYLEEIDDTKLRINNLSKRDKLSSKKNFGWYKYVGREHNLTFNIPYILSYVNHLKDKMDTETYYAFLTLIVIHEYRHYMQGAAIYNNKQVDELSQDDILNTERILLIKFFYDAYYYLNKNDFKYELDALKYAIITGTKYLDEKYPNINASRAMLNALKIYEKEFATTDAVTKIDEKMKSASRVDLNDSLIVVNPKIYGNHGYYGLEHDKLFTEDLISQYATEEDVLKKDKILYDAILSSCTKPYDVVTKYPALRKEYIENYRKIKK